MRAFPAGNDVILRLDPGDEIIASLNAWLQETDIPLASVSGIGAISACEIGRYLLSDKRYETQVHHGEFEIIALLGTISRMAGKPYVHLHLAFADENMVMRGGHLSSATVSVTAEIVIRRLDGEIDRALHTPTGINRIEPA